MNVKQILKTFCFHFFLIYGLTVIVSFFWCFAVGDKCIPIDFFWKIMLFSLVADLPVFVFWSRRELTSRQTLIRIIIHGVLLEILLPTAGYFIGMWHDVGGFFIFFVVVLVVDASVFGITFLMTSVEAGSINSALKKRRSEKNEKEAVNGDFGQDNRDTKPE